MGGHFDVMLMLCYVMLMMLCLRYACYASQVMLNYISCLCCAVLYTEHGHIYRRKSKGIIVEKVVLPF